MTMDHWCSPPDVCDALEDFFGGPVDVDPCSNARSLVRAVRAFTAGGLHMPWGKKSYRNCPYSALDLWTDKTIYEIRVGHVHEIVTLDPVAPSTRWWRKTVGDMPVLVKDVPGANPGLLKRGQREIRAPGGVHMFAKRIAFINTKGVIDTSPRHDPVFTYYGPRKKAFVKAFKRFESWTVIR